MSQGMRKNTSTVTGSLTLPGEQLSTTGLASVPLDDDGEVEDGMQEIVDVTTPATGIVAKQAGWGLWHSAK